MSIGCNLLFAHRNVHELNLKYYYMGHPFLFYKYWKNPYSRKYQRNMLGPLYRKKIKLNSRTNYFTSLSNYFGLKGANVNYLHHFGSQHSRLESVDFTNSFSSMEGGFNPSRLKDALELADTFESPWPYDLDTAGSVAGLTDIEKPPYNQPLGL